MEERVLRQKSGVIIYQIVQYGTTDPQNPYDHCLSCSKYIPSGSYGLVTIVAEGYAWCRECATRRLYAEPDLLEFLKGLP